METEDLILLTIMAGGLISIGVLFCKMVLIYCDEMLKRAKRMKKNSEQ